MQASVQSGSIRLADNGARLADRLSALHRDIQKQEQLIMSKRTSGTVAMIPQGVDRMLNLQALTDNGPASQHQPSIRQADRASIGKPNTSYLSQQRSSTTRQAAGKGTSEDHLPQQHADHDQPIKLDRSGRGNSERGGDGRQQQRAQHTQHAERDSSQSQQSERGVGSSDRRGGRSGLDGGRGRGRGSQSSVDLNRYVR